MEECPLCGDQIVTHGEGEKLFFQCSNYEVCGYREDIPVADIAADRILHEYQLSTYSLAYEPDISAATQAGKTIRRLSFRALFQRILSRE